MYAPALEFRAHCLIHVLNPDYSKLPSVPPVELVYLLDPLIATGGTACAAMHMILDWGVPGKSPNDISAKYFSPLTRRYSIESKASLCPGIRSWTTERPKTVPGIGGQYTIVYVFRILSTHALTDLGSRCRPQFDTQGTHLTRSWRYSKYKIQFKIVR